MSPRFEPKRVTLKMSIVPASSYSWFENDAFYKKRHLFFGTPCTYSDLLLAFCCLLLAYSCFLLCAACYLLLVTCYLLLSWAVLLFWLGGSVGMWVSLEFGNNANSAPNYVGVGAGAKEPLSFCPKFLIFFGGSVHTFKGPRR